MKTIIITKKADAKKLGVSVGTMVNYEDAPEYLQKRHDSIMGSKASDECIKRNADARITALKIREGVAKAHGTHANTFSSSDDMVLGLIIAADFNGIMALPA